MIVSNSFMRWINNLECFGFYVFGTSSKVIDLWHLMWFSLKYGIFIGIF